VAALTERFGCGMPTVATSRRCCTDIPPMCVAWLLPPIASSCSVAVRMATCGCGTSNLRNVCAYCRVTQQHSTYWACVPMAHDCDHLDTWFWGVAWSPDGKRLAGTTYGRGMLLWEMRTRSGHWIGRELAAWIRRLAWSPDGTRLVAGAGDGHLYVWDVQGGRL